MINFSSACRFAVVAAVAAGVVVPVTSVAAATALPVAESAVMSASTPYCAQQLLPDVPAEAQTLTLQCFTREVDAMSVATGDASYRSLSQAAGRQKLMATQTKRATTRIAPRGSSVAAVPTNSGSVLLSTNYDGLNSTGAGLYWYGAVKCGQNGTTYNVGNIGSTWNDRIRSVYTWGASNCNHNYYYLDQNYGGGSPLECGLVVGGCGSMGSYDKKATSIKWSI